MKALWNFIQRRHVSVAAKNKLWLGILILLNLAAGGLVWLAAGRLILPGIGYLLDFMACPAILFGFFGGIIYLYNHEFSVTAAVRETAPAAAVPPVASSSAGTACRAAARN